MILLQAHHISKSYGANPILTNINLDIQSGERIGLVGVNGAGKSTLLKILIGQLSADEGELYKAKDIRLGYLAQSTALSSQATIWEEMLSIFAELREKEQQLRQLEQELAAAQRLTEQEYTQLLQEYDHLAHSFSQENGYQYESLIRNVLHGLKFADKDYNDPISTLSGGQKTRLALAKLLLQSPDILILDEPTNYLDLETLAWLETYLLTYTGAILVVSHDRYFLDALVNVIYEIDQTKAKKYIGNYTAFLEQKAELYQQQLKQFRKQQQEIQKTEDFIQRNVARASTTKRAQSRRKSLEKMEILSEPQGQTRTASFRFDIDRQSGNDVLHVENLATGYAPDQLLAQHLSFQVYRGDRIAIVGPNGIGKTTLLRTLIGQLPSCAGSIRRGANVTISYYDQEQDELHLQKTVLQELWDEYPHLLEQEARRVLGQFLFSQNEVEKLVQELSGGEKARLSLAKLMLQKSNLLILDEPTNHLDLYSKEVLEEALIDYPGTIIFVSHDRYFLNRIATKVLELSKDGVQLFLGNYDYYIHKKEELAEIKRLQIEEKAELKPDNSAKLTYEQQKEQQRVERQRQRRNEEIEEQIALLEIQIEEWELSLYQPEVYEDFEKAAKIQQQIERAKVELEQLIEEWTLLHET